MSGSQTESEDGVDPFLVAQFDRAVELVQTLPKNGPIQSSYEEKLALYSAYKQGEHTSVEVTEGDVTGPRPGIFELLARSKWDAWNSRQNMTTDEAMAAYVDVLLKMLKRYKDRQEARNIIQEFRQARAMAASSSFAGSQEWQSTTSFVGSSSPPRDERSRERTASSSGSSTSSSPPAPIPPNLHSLAASSDPTPRPTPAHSRLFEIPDPKLPPPDLSPPYITSHLPGLEPASTAAAEDLRSGLPSLARTHILQDPTNASFTGPSLPLPMPTPEAASTQPPPPRSLTPPLSSPPSGATAPLTPPVRPMLLSTTSVDSQAFSTALERIQVSLQALHERLESLETATLREQQRANPLRTLLFPSGRGRQVGIPRLLWTLTKRTFTDALLALTCISVWLLVTGQRGFRRSSVRDFWASIVQLLWRRWQQPHAGLTLPVIIQSPHYKGDHRGER